MLMLMPKIRTETRHYTVAIVPVAEMLLANGADLRARNAQGERFELLVLRHPEPLPSDSRIPLPRIALLLQDHLAV